MERGVDEVVRIGVQSTDAVIEGVGGEREGPRRADLPYRPHLAEGIRVGTGFDVRVEDDVLKIVEKERRSQNGKVNRAADGKQACQGKSPKTPGRVIPRRQIFCGNRSHAFSDYTKFRNLSFYLVIFNPA